MSYTEEEIASFGSFQSSTIEKPNVQCPEGFTKNSQGRCVKIAKTTSTTPGAVVEKEIASDGDSNSENTSLDSQDPKNYIKAYNQQGLDKVIKAVEEAEETKELPLYTYEQLMFDEKTDKEINIFNKNYKPKTKDIDDIGEFNVEEDVLEKSTAMLSSLVKNNAVIKDELVPKAIVNIYSDLEEEKKKIDSKYDLTNPDELLKAQSEFSNIFQEKMDIELNKSEEYKNIIKTYQDKVADQAGIQTRKLVRTSLGLDDEETQGYVSAFLETATGFLSETIPIAFNNLQNMVEGGNLNQSSRRADKLKDILLNQESDFNKEDKFDQKFINENYDSTTRVEFKALEEIGEDGTIQDAIDYMEKREIKMKADVQTNFDDLAKLEWRQQWERQANIFDEDGLTGIDIATMAGKQIFQLPLAYFTYGMSAALQETAGNYSANLKALAVKEYGLKEGEEPTDEQMMRLMEEGKDDKIISIVSGIASGALEYIGAKKAVTAALFGKSMVGSFLRGEFLLAGKAALQTGAAALESGFYESITETGQSVIGQTGQSIVGNKNYFNFEEILESGGQGFVIGTLFPLAGGAARQGMTEYRTTAAKISAKYGNDSYGELLYKEMEAGVNKRFEEENTEKWQQENPDKKPMGEQERREKILNIGQVRTANNKIPKSMENVEDKQKSIELLIEKKELADKNKDVDPAQFAQEDKNRIKQINLELTLLSGKAGLRKITIEDQKQMTEMVNALDNINAETYDTTEEAQAAWDSVVDKYASQNKINGVDLDSLNEKDRG